MKDGEDKSSAEAVTIYNAIPDTKVPVRAMPGLIWDGLKIVLNAGRREFILVAIIQVISAGAIFAQLLLAKIALQGLLSTVQSHGSLLPVIFPAIAIGVVSAGLLLGTTIQGERQQILGELVGRKVEQKIFDVATTVELEVFEDTKFHNRIERVRMQSQRPLTLVFGISGMAGALLGVLGVIGALIALQPILVPLAVLVLIPAPLVAKRRGEALWRFSWRMTPRDRERQYIAGLLSGRDEAKEIRAFGISELLRERYERLSEERVAELRKVAGRHLRSALVADVAIAAALIGMVLLVAWLTASGRATIEESAVGLAGIALIGTRLTQAAMATGALAESALFINDYIIFMEMLPNTPRTPASEAAPAGFRRLEVNGLTFTYPTGERPAISDISLEIKAGEIVALVGESGSGKTTLAKLLARLYIPDKGSILWDDVDIKTVDPAALHRSVTVIFEDYLRYQLPARENIGLGRPEALDDIAGIRNAARQSGADTFLSELQSGYDTMLGPRFWGGTDLSNGQWQRVALARAFFRAAPFVILDEPTAALDARAEHDLFQRLRTLLADRTVLMISHRFSSVRSADRIYVLDKGQIVDSGDHEELIRRGGLYAELFRLQAAAYNDHEPSARATVVGDLSGVPREAAENQ